MHLHLTCRYCGNKWEAFANSKEAVEYMSCGICGDTGVEVRDATKVQKIDYYVGCPPFPDKELAIKEQAKYNTQWLWDSQLANSSTLKDF